MLVCFFFLHEIVSGEQAHKLRRKLLGVFCFAAGATPQPWLASNSRASSSFCQPRARARAGVHTALRRGDAWEPRGCARSPSPPQARSPAPAALTMAARLAPWPRSAANPHRAPRARTTTAMAPGCPARCLTRPRSRRPPERGGRRARCWVQPELSASGERTLAGAPRGPWATPPRSVALASAATVPRAQVQHPGATRDRGTGRDKLPPVH